MQLGAIGGGPVDRRAPSRSGLSSAEMMIQAKLPASCPAMTTMAAPPKATVAPLPASRNMTKPSGSR